MRVVDAFWEKENLNRNVLEINFEKHDSINELNKINNIDNYDYIVAKIPKKNIDLIHQMEDNGYRFIETQFELKNNLKTDFKEDKIMQKIGKEISYKRLTKKEELKDLFQNIDLGIFDTDRVALDPFLGKEYSIKRYNNWIGNIFNDDDTVVCEIIYKNKKIGFFLLKSVDEFTMDSVLAGLYKKEVSEGLGFTIVQKHLEWCLQNKIKKVITKVSSNNIDSLKLHLLFGYKITDLVYVFRKINKR